MPHDLPCIREPKCVRDATPRAHFFHIHRIRRTHQQIGSQPNHSPQLLNRCRKVLRTLRLPVLLPDHLPSHPPRRTPATVKNRAHTSERPASLPQGPSSASHVAPQYLAATPSSAPLPPLQSPTHDPSRTHTRETHPHAPSSQGRLPATSSFPADHADEHAASAIFPPISKTPRNLFERIRNKIHIMQRTQTSLSTTPLNMQLDRNPARQRPTRDVMKRKPLQRSRQSRSIRRVQESIAIHWLSAHIFPANLLPNYCPDSKPISS